MMVKPLIFKRDKIIYLPMYCLEGFSNEAMAVSVSVPNHWNLI